MDNGGGGDSSSYKSCKAPVKCRHQHPTFSRPDAPSPVTQPTVQLIHSLQQLVFLGTNDLTLECFIVLRKVINNICGY